MANYATFLAGLQASYDSLGEYDDSTLYWCTDSGKIYKGSVDFSNHMVLAASKPESPIVGKIYFLLDTNTVESYVNGQWMVISYPATSSISATSTDAEVTTAKGVYDFVNAAIEDITGHGMVVTDIQPGEQDATLDVTEAGATTSITVPGVVTTPSYEASTRTITLPVSDGDDVVIELGKDIFLDPDADNGYNPDTGNIELHLNDGTEIDIPAEALIATCTGEETTTATVTVADGNVISVDVKVSESDNNSLTIDETNGGLLLDLTDYAKKEDIDEAISDLQDAVDSLEEQVTENTNAITILNGDNTVEGSVAYQIEQAISDVDSDINDLTEQVEENTENITNIISALEWGEF